jgi:hypothetical protein
MKNLMYQLGIYYECVEIYSAAVDPLLWFGNKLIFLSNFVMIPRMCRIFRRLPVRIPVTASWSTDLPQSTTLLWSTDLSWSTNLPTWMTMASLVSTMWRQRRWIAVRGQSRSRYHLLDILIRWFLHKTSEVCQFYSFWSMKKSGK